VVCFLVCGQCGWKLSAHPQNTAKTPFTNRAFTAAAALFPAAAAKSEEAAGVASSRMSYSRFLEYLDMGRVKKVGVMFFTRLCSVSIRWAISIRRWNPCSSLFLSFARCTPFSSHQ
jgi:hypothetical protein